MEIPKNKENQTTSNIEKAIESIIEQLSSNDSAQLTRSSINCSEAKIIADKFYEKGYHHEIRMHTNQYGNTFFYCLNVSKRYNRTDDARYAWSEYVK